MTIKTGDFNPYVDRRDTNSLKWEKYRDRDILPLWVADSDFECAPAIISALTSRVQHGVFGYHNPYQNEAAIPAIQRWLVKQYNWHVQSDWIVWTPGVVPAFNMMCQAFCEPGDGVLVQVPNYPPLLNAPLSNNLIQETISTNFINGRWQLDLDELEQKAAKPSTKLFLLCNPMNPCGSVLTRAELDVIQRICLKHDVKLCSDEIHADLILEQGQRHIPAGSLTEIGEQAVTLMAASKTFNVAGFGVSFAVIQDRQTRAKFKAAGRGIAPSANNFGVLATTVAFNECDDWYLQQLEYLRENQKYLASEIKDISGLTYQPSAATFLAWIDCSGLNRKNLQLYLESLGLGPSPGIDFGWPQFARINFACSREMLVEAVERLKKVTVLK